ncbi:hypothetical protein ACFSBZ_00115 [Amnibacterium flavum]|uniref:Hemagglutinin n=1 Tax=Amnibacterium flavum TaxID=2173173 RepID=A0A2V1HZ56_9MICO|nr:hypothetical protein [Amnibacterium flavum]PVZ96247.1 hypothetical protein DDQ50_07485 [Amnibacterium flavum]
MPGIWSTVAAGAVVILAALTLPHGIPEAPQSAASASAVAPTSGTQSASLVVLRAADSADFDPGFLISDERFYDDTAMTAAEVQAFLEQTACRPVDGVDCLADYRQSTPDVPAVGAGHCGRYVGDEWESAAVIIAGVARACGINPEVLLVLLQKEQSLITRPNPSGYERAMGYACPDTADCDTEYFGFFNQVYNAAWQFRQYTLFPTDRGFAIGTNDVLYNPEASCGSGPVEIRNQATANLYLYTPYQPNDAALANLYGDGDACSSYGNRNFWRIFTDWFGDPAASRFPAWMGQCLTRDDGDPCLDAFWVAPPER